MGTRSRCDGRIPWVLHPGRRPSIEPRNSAIHEGRPVAVCHGRPARRLDTCRLTPEKREQVRHALDLEAMLIR